MPPQGAVRRGVVSGVPRHGARDYVLRASAIGISAPRILRARRERLANRPRCRGNRCRELLGIGTAGESIMPARGSEPRPTISRERRQMSIVKVIEVIAESPKSWDDAAGKAVTEVAKTVDGITEIWVSGMKAIVENNKIVRYRITAKVSFVVKGREK